MQTYVVLENWTDLGIRDFRESQKRSEASADVMARRPMSRRSSAMRPTASMASGATAPV